jgi:hypothetical protein
VRPSWFVPLRALALPHIFWLDGVTHDPQRTIRRTAADPLNAPTRAAPENKPGKPVLF